MILWLVLDENTLGYTFDLLYMQILWPSGLRNSPYSHLQGCVPLPPCRQAENVRKATPQDFEDYGIVYSGQLEEDDTI